MADGKTETFSVKMGDGISASANAGADSLEGLRSSIESAQASMKVMRASMGLLSGTSEEVKKAKEGLKAKIDAEKNAISAANLQIMKQGANYAQLAEAKKKAAAAKGGLDIDTKGAESAISSLGGPLASLKSHFDTVKNAAGGGGLGAALGVTTLAVGVLIAAIQKLVSALVDAGVALVSFVVKSADAARSAGLLREAAFGGNVQWGRAFGEQVDALARKVPKTKDQLNELGASLADANIGGQAWVHTLNAMAQAKSDSAAGKIKSLIEAGVQLNRLQIQPPDLQGVGVSFDEVAGQLGRGMKGGIVAARQALRDGTVKLADGAAALRAAVENRFGEINLRKSLSLDSLAAKFKENLAGLTKNVNLEPLLKALKSIVDVFDTSTVSGKALQQMVTLIGDALGGAAGKGAPIFKRILYGIIIAAQQVIITFLQVRNALRDAFGDNKTVQSMDLVKFATNNLLTLFRGLAIAISASANGLVAFIRGTAAIIGAVNGAAKALTSAFSPSTWQKMGAGLVEGLILGIASKATGLATTVKDLGEQAKKAFQQATDQHSPSRDFMKMGRQLPAGAEQGVDQGADKVSAAVERMAGGAKGAFKGSSVKAGAPSIVLNATFHVNGVPSGSALDELEAQLAELLSRAANTAGLAVVG